jgi:hypothetical protein
MVELRNRRLVVVAQDPNVRRAGKVVTAEIEVPYEELEPGPVGHRAHVVDYNSTTQTMYRPVRVPEREAPPKVGTTTILRDPGFHALNVYALVMRTLARFEHALGRRVQWGFPAHQLKLVPHAFEEANAFYSRESESLLFGYYRGGGKTNLMCMSHDIVVHETAHALLDGLRRRFLAPSSADQAAFHEGFADIIALLSVFSLEQVLEALLDEDDSAAPAGLIHKNAVTVPRLKNSVLLGLAAAIDPQSDLGRVNALRRSVTLKEDKQALSLEEFKEPHRRGEVLVAAVMRAFLEVWTNRLTALGSIQGDYLDRKRVAEEGAVVADLLLTAAIRALDYTPPVHIDFGDYLSALLTADREVRGERDTRYGLRKSLTTWFANYGITPGSDADDGLWRRSDIQLGREGVHYGSLQNDPTEMFRLVWANRHRLRFDPTAYMQVASVRPCVRTSPDDGLVLRETVAECTEYLSVPASELQRRYKLRKPAGMRDDQEVVLEGGSTLILDEYGTLKYDIYNSLPSQLTAKGRENVQDRLDYLWNQGYYDRGARLSSRLSAIHRRRAGEAVSRRDEVW